MEWKGVLGGSWVLQVELEVPIWVITIVILLITLLITTHESPSGEGRRIGIRVQRFALEGSGD